MTTNVTVINKDDCKNYTFDKSLEEFKKDYNEQIVKQGHFAGIAVDGKEVSINPLKSIRIDISEGLF